jgi:hypothetical protein
MRANKHAEGAIDAAYLKSIMSYDPKTGIFTRLKTNNQHQCGAEPGNLRKTGYRFIGVNGKPFAAHRLAWLYMTGNWPTERVDHINGVKSDNRWTNLREATDAQNKANEGVRKDNALGIKGVRLHESGRYQARIFRDKRHKSLGLFDTAKEAAAAYAKASRLVFGEFARTA